MIADVLGVQDLFSTVHFLVDVVSVIIGEMPIIRS
jgi:hypothetical protein